MHRERECGDWRCCGLLTVDSASTYAVFGKGNKRVVFSTTSWVGTKNTFLGYRSFDDPVSPLCKLQRSALCSVIVLVRLR